MCMWLAQAAVSKALTMQDWSSSPRRATCHQPPHLCPCRNSGPCSIQPLTMPQASLTNYNKKKSNGLRSGRSKRQLYR